MLFEFTGLLDTTVSAVVFSSVGLDGWLSNSAKISLNWLESVNWASSIVLMSKFNFCPVVASTKSTCACNKSLLNCVISFCNASISAELVSYPIYSHY